MGSEPRQNHPPRASHRQLLLRSSNARPRDEDQDELRPLKTNRSGVAWGIKVGGALLVLLALIPYILFQNLENTVAVTVLVAVVAVTWTLMLKKNWLPAGVLLALLVAFYVWILLRPVLGSG